MTAKKTPAPLVWLENRINGERHQVEAGHPDTLRTRFRLSGPQEPVCVACGRALPDTKADAPASPAVDQDAPNGTPEA